MTAAGDRERRGRRDAINAERALCQTDPVEQDLIDDDREAERRDREIMSAQAHGEQRKEHAGEAGERDAAANAAQNGTPNFEISRVET